MTELYQLTLAQARTSLQERQCSAVELVSSCLDRIKTTEPEINACISVSDKALQEAAQIDASGPNPAKPLWGVPVTVKDMFCTKEMRTTAASKMLENYTSNYDAQVVARLKEAGAIILAKTNQDEFALGTTGELSFFGPTKNPWDKSKIPGGSSSGAAASVAAFQTPGAFGSDTGGSIRQPAARCGCVGFKPTYGRVSRYGLIPVAGSFDQAGPLARRVMDCALLLAAVAGPDARDCTSSPSQPEDYTAIKPRELKGLKLGIIKELWEGALTSEVAATLQEATCKLEAAGVQLVPLSLPNLRYAPAAYQILSMAEASTNLSRYDGAHFGFRAENPRDLNELYVASRSLALGPEVQRRIILGTFFLSAEAYENYYKKAARVRRLIRDDYHQALESCDFLLSPTNTSVAQDLDSLQNLVQASQLDITTLPDNLAGLPALTLPAGLGSESKLPVGIQLTGRPFSEMDILSVGLSLEEVCPPLL